MLEFLLEPLQLAFMQRAILAALLIGVTSGVVGAYVVTRGMSFLGDALAHSVLPGVAVAFLTGGNLLFGGLVAGVLAAIVIALLTRRRRLQEDTAIGIVFAGMLAIGIALISSRHVATDLQHILIGNILAVGEQDLLYMALISFVILLTIGLFYKELLISSFDATLAQSLQLPSESLHILLLVLIAITVVVGVQAVGVTLVAATLVTPAATARFFVKRLHSMMLLSALIASLSGLIGMYITWYTDIAASATIVLSMTAFFALAFLFAPNTGYLWSLLGKSSQSA